VLLRSIREIADEPVSLMPDDQDAEFVNTRWLSAPAEQRSLMSVDQMLAAFFETHEHR
jgi:hypothetical protein